jgi:hypothetical protein
MKLTVEEQNNLFPLFAFNFYVRPAVLYTYDGSVKCAVQIVATLILLTWVFTSRKGVICVLTYFNMPCPYKMAKQFILL